LTQLLRDGREFTLAEIEHYTIDKTTHPKFERIADTIIPVLLPTQEHLGIQRMTVREAIAKRIVDNQTIGYYMARTLLFLQRIGLNVYV
jgi:glycyl-tRNA synthetase